MNFTVSRRQQKLYQQHNFDLRKWEVLVEDGNALRKAIANEYDVEWDELREEKDEKVQQALKKERVRKQDSKKNKDDEDEPRSGKDDKHEK
jgi:hypothetical protein